MMMVMVMVMMMTMPDVDMGVSQLAVSGCVSPIWSEPPPLVGLLPRTPDLNTPLFHLTLCQGGCHINGCEAVEGRPMGARPMAAPQAEAPCREV